MQLILTPPPNVVVILKEISFNCGSPDPVATCSVKNIASCQTAMGVNANTITCRDPSGKSSAPASQRRRCIKKVPESTQFE